MIITIDGASGTGKSSVAKEVARRLGFAFFDTGAMYRLAAYALLQAKTPLEEEEKIQKELKHFSLDIRRGSLGERRYFWRSVDCTEAIRMPEVSVAASQIATYLSVRKQMVEIQREYAKQQSTIFEGRDMGTVVFPHADVKVFLKADLSIRAQRRWEELIQKFPEKIFEKETIFQEMKERDEADSQRKYSPLKQASDAEVIDTSHLSLEEVVQQVILLVRKKQLKKKPKSWLYPIVLFLTRCFFKLFYRYEVFGVENFCQGAAILAANHLSFLDPPLVAISSPGEIHFLAKASLFRKFLFGRLIHALNAHPVTKNTSNVKIFHRVLDLLSQGEKVLLFPEGSRSFSGEIKPLQSGIALLAYQARCPIIPVYIHGTYEVWKRGKRLPRLFGKCICIFGSPIPWEKVKHLGKKEAIQKWVSLTEDSLQQMAKTWQKKTDKMIKN